MRYVGLDIHKKVIEVAVIDETGELIMRRRLDCQREQIVRFARRVLGPDCRVALEATTNTWAIVELIEPFVDQVVVSNPLKTRAIAEAKIKTDKVDAETLAQLLRCEYLPSVWQPDADSRELRSLTSRRACLVGDSTRIKNRIHAVLHQRLIHYTKTKLFSAGGLSWLRELQLDPLGREAIDSELRLLEAVEQEKQRLATQIAVRAEDDPRARMLMTLPGWDVTVTQSVLSTLGDVHRFRSGDHAASYLGLVPSTRQSARRCYHGSITKQGNSQARWMLVQAAQNVATHPGPLGAFFRRVAKRKGRNVAVVAAARKMVVIAWHMLKNNEPYRYAQPRTVEAKLGRLRVAAGKPRRKGGYPKGSKRSASYGTGQHTRAVRSIDQVYERDGLPELPALSEGEKRTVQSAGAQEFVKQIHNARRVPRRSGTKTQAQETT